MRTQINEQTVLFFSIVKWSILATIIGAVVGFAIHYFIFAVDISSIYVGALPSHLLLIPLGLATSTLLVNTFAPKAKGHGTEKVIAAIHQNNGRIQPKVIPIKVLATIVTIATGGSVGKEGPSAQIGSGIASLFADLIRLDVHDRKKIVICGISAGFAAVFGTPIAGSIFGIEVLFVGKMLYDVLLPSLIAGITSFEVVTLLGTKPLRVPIQSTIDTTHIVPLIAAGLVFGAMALLFIKSLHEIEHIAERLPMDPLIKSLIGGGMLIIAALTIGQPYLGLGTGMLESSLQGIAVPWYSSIAKILFTDITLAFGGSGGVLAPVFFIGSTAGNAFANLFHLDRQVYTALGMVGVLAAATNAPISAILLASEIFGPSILLPAAIVASVSYMITGHNSIYPSQILAIKKTVSLDAEVGEELQHISSSLALRDTGFNKVITKPLKKLLGEQKAKPSKKR